MKITALYARVSTGRQEKEETIDSQLAEVKERIKQDGNVLHESCIFVDDGWSGELLMRPALDTMRDAAARKEFEILYVYDRGRLSRKFAYQEVIIDELKDKGIAFVTLHDAPADTPEAHVMQAMQGVFHEYERVKIAERMRRGKIYKAKSGNVVHGDAPYGYHYVYKTKDHDCYFEINPQEAGVVKQIFCWVADEQMTIRQVIKRLYEQKIPPRKAKRETWTNGPLSRMLRNEAYVGTTYYNKNYAVAPTKPQNKEKYKKVKLSSRRLRPKEEWIAIPVPRIIDDDLFSRVQKQLVINAQFAMRNKKHEYLLSGLAWCACGSRFFGEGSGTQFYYRCTDRLKTYPKPPECRGAGVNTIRLDNPVWGKIEELFTSPKLLEKQIERWTANRSTARRTNEMVLQRERLLRALESLDDEEKRYVKAYGEGLVSLELFKQSIEGVKKRKAVASEQLKGTHQEPEASEPQQLPPADYIRTQFPVIVRQLKLQEKQTVLRKLVKEIVVNNERTSATIHGYIPLYLSEAEGEPKYGLESQGRDCGTSERREIDAV